MSLTFNYHLKPKEITGVINDFRKHIPESSGHWISDKGKLFDKDNKEVGKLQLKETYRQRLRDVLDILQKGYILLCEDFTGNYRTVSDTLTRIDRVAFRPLKDKYVISNIHASDVVAGMAFTITYEGWNPKEGSVYWKRMWRSDGPAEWVFRNPMNVNIEHLMMEVPETPQSL